jgi:hypothetical protein
MIGRRRTDANSVLDVAFLSAPLTRLCIIREQSQGRPSDQLY